MTAKNYTVIDFEQQKGMIRVLLALRDDEIRNIVSIKRIIVMGTAIYRAIDKLEAMKLIERRPIMNNPNEKRYQITEKGMKITKLLLEINDILEEQI